MARPDGDDTEPSKSTGASEESSSRAAEESVARERELRAGGAASGVVAGAAFGGAEGAAVGAALEGGKSASDSIRPDARSSAKGKAKPDRDTSDPSKTKEQSGSRDGSGTSTPDGKASTPGGASSKAASAASSTRGAAKSAMNVAAASSKSEMASRGAGEAMKRSGSSTMKAAGTVLSADGSMSDKAQQGAALAAGALAATAISSTGVGVAGSKIAAEATTRVVGSQAVKKNWWIIALVMASTTLGPMLLVGALIMVAVPVIAISVTSTTGEANDTQAVCTPGDGGSAQLTGSGIEEKAWNYLVGEGWSEEQAAGVMGNIKRESQFNPFMTESATSTPNTSRGWGLVQWTADRHVAIRDVVKADLGDNLYVAAPSYEEMPAGLSQDDIDKMVLFQLEYISQELASNEKAAGDALRNTTTVSEATEIFESEYERAGVVELDERVTHAEGYYALYAGTAPTAPDPAGQNLTDSGSADAPCGTSSGGGGSAAMPVAGPMGPVIQAAEETLGNPYVFGGGDGNGSGSGSRAGDAGEVGFDCSSVTGYAYLQGAGVELPRMAREQWAHLRSNEVSVDELQPGDLLFYAYGDRLGDGVVSHVAVYVGGGMMIEASVSSNEVVRVPARTTGFGFTGAARVMETSATEDATGGASSGGDAE